MQTDAAGSDHAGRRLGLFFGAYFALVGILAPYMPLYFEHRGLTAVEVGVLVALAQAMRMVGPNLWGWLADRSGHRTSILRSTSLALVASFALLFFPGGFGHWKWLLALGGGSVLLFLFGYFVFDRLRDSFAEEV